MAPRRLPSLLKSYSIGSAPKRATIATAATATAAERAVAAAAYRETNPANGRESLPVGTARPQGRSRSASTSQEGIKKYVVIQQSSIPAAPMKANWLKPRKRVAASEA